MNQYKYVGNYIKNLLNKDIVKFGIIGLILGIFQTLNSFNSSNLITKTLFYSTYIPILVIDRLLPSFKYEDYNTAYMVLGTISSSLFAIFIYSVFINIRKVFLILNKDGTWRLKINKEQLWKISYIFMWIFLGIIMINFWIPFGLEESIIYIVINSIVIFWTSSHKYKDIKIKYPLDYEKRLWYYLLYVSIIVIILINITGYLLTTFLL